MSKRYAPSALQRFSESRLTTIAMEEHGHIFDTEQKDQMIAYILEQQDLDATPEDPADVVDMTADVAETPEYSEDEDAKSVRLTKMLNEKVWLMIANEQGSGGDQPVPLQVNGNAIVIKRNQWVDVRKLFVNLLDTLVQDVAEKVEEDGKQVLKARQVPRFNYQVRTLAEGPGKTPDKQGGNAEPRFRL